MKALHLATRGYAAVMAESVLIVDDDPVIQLLLRVNFEMDGFDVVTASDGEAGLEAAEQQDFNLILLDVVMPKLDGYEVLSRLRKNVRTAQTPIVLLSAKTLEADRQSGLDAGATDYVTKPFDPITILKDMKKLLAAV